MKRIVHILILLRICVASQEDIWMNWAVSIKNEDAAEFCNGVLVAYRHALTTCECTTHPDFVFPEFLRRTAGQYVVTIRENQEGYQIRKVLRFHPHPKCTSNYFVQGFLNYNFAVVTVTERFEKTEYVQPIEKWRINSDGAVSVNSKCILMGRDSRSLISPFPISLKREEGCSERASLALGAEPINFEEKGMLCADLERGSLCNASGVCENYQRFGTSSTTDSQPANEAGQNVPDICDGIVVSGAPLVCDGSLVGLVGHSLCKLNSVPVIISRIELANSLIGRLSVGEKSANPQVLLKISAAVLILSNL